MKNILGLFSLIAFAATINVSTCKANVPKTEKVCFADVQNEFEINCVAPYASVIEVVNFVANETPVMFIHSFETAELNSLEGGPTDGYRQDSPKYASPANVYNFNYDLHLYCLYLKPNKPKPIKQWDLVTNPVRNSKIDNCLILRC